MDKETKEFFEEQFNKLETREVKFKTEINRHFDVVAEHLEGKIQLLAEQVAANTVKLEEHDQRFDQVDQRLDKVDQRLDKIDGDLEIIKSDLGIVKQDLKQKVSYDEFASLEQRVIHLEAKVK
jgi:DNA repair exonuclease SbcCD ATPase subunit